MKLGKFFVYLAEKIIRRSVVSCNVAHGREFLCTLLTFQVKVVETSASWERIVWSMQLTERATAPIIDSLSQIRLVLFSLVNALVIVSTVCDSLLLTVRWYVCRRRRVCSAVCRLLNWRSEISACTSRRRVQNFAFSLAVF